jgi:two-component system OmpR family response regulator
MNASPHILVVEDDAEISRLVSRYLRTNDLHVSVLPDGRNMDRALEDNRVDLIVLDLMLPGEDGLTLCRRLRTRSEVPVIMLTAKGEELDRTSGSKWGRTIICRSHSIRVSCWHVSGRCCGGSTPPRRASTGAPAR